MANGSGDRESIDGLTMALTDALAEAGLDPHDYQLSTYVDVEALAGVVGSIDGPYTIRFEVKDIEVLLTDERLEVSVPTLKE